MTSIFHSGLSKDLSSILNDADDFNVIIQVGENQNTKEFRAHSVILRARSPYFKSAFSDEWISKENNMIVFNKPNITPKVFDMILKYIYTGELDLTKQSGEDILSLLVSSDELLIDELFNHVQDYLIEKQTSWVQKNFVLVLHTVFKLTSCKKLQDYCLESICEDPESFISLKMFSSLDKDILFGLLKRDDFQIKEIDIWDCLIKWGIEQTPGLGSDRTKWNNENYEALKKTLNQFIPLIRFVEISSEDFFDKVRPYKAIISHHIYEELEEFYYKKTLPKATTLPPRTGKSGLLTSTIIKPKLINIISNWINRNDSATLSNNNKFKFNLIYLMSRDGFNNVTFYNKCNRQGPFVVLIRVQSNKIYGGYNPIGYTGRDRWLSSTESFVFSFENDQDIHNMKICRSLNTNRSVLDYCNYDKFFSFGDMLYIYEQNLFVGYNNSHYENNFGVENSSYFIEEIEVFSVVKK
ncbi:uncharacterized protein OCT59_006042 [Rhizophagus irregularis]|uniref:Uncharacterized protein n=2 Tax=Rhizophagus irregularis TaxID=588596 RepID=U9T493_RHIID|nr:hypothetical protein GLOIN_2v1778271 [Rhizophagus irregularis DAOM 181602=DAOM 197198]EXX57669.1 hypothetical protein RirG_205010 [Rhizophagus irregularis DAOM 197198w]POG68476.1 hypothetical protein GLOIN_2v1778271 [Rhizophagus irregularis DAOM 181602=DAOM 197198]UZO14586.1 hypothetical protein OCT59_006042 [Rhizophagus irregularis]GBC38328.1 hypothetical protein GLOIN_2v1778271 [Rhizophagus irregularis DAOM 181602=DAOM 197198]|eukprot:XP_025175342.1 hypothetical protein GLOIN_2v1778271 [Rhizophagus irregularis DAOM 181602=DAOM 197198]